MYHTLYLTLSCNPRLWSFNSALKGTALRGHAIRISISSPPTLRSGNHETSIEEDEETHTSKRTMQRANSVS